jgi:hypothetical protein
MIHIICLVSSFLKSIPKINTNLTDLKWFKYHKIRSKQVNKIKLKTKHSETKSSKLYYEII